MLRVGVMEIEDTLARRRNTYYSMLDKCRSGRIAVRVLQCLDALSRARMESGPRPAAAPRCLPT